MFERFTDRARHVVVLAQESARSMKHNYIGTEHILLGLLAEEDGFAARVLADLGFSHEKAQRGLLGIVGEGEEALAGPLPHTLRAKKVYELALREALSLGHNYIGTEHILLGMVRENEGVAARILLDHEINSTQVRDRIIKSLSKPRREVAMNKIEIETIDRRTITARFPVQPEGVGEIATVLAGAAEEGYRLDGAEHIMSGHQRDEYVVGVKLKLVRGATS